MGRTTVGRRTRVSLPPSGTTVRRRGRLDDWRKRKRKRRHYGYEYVVSIFHVIFSFFVLAFPELSSLRTHFRPFTEVMRKGRREVTWKMSKTDMANQIDDTSGRMVQLACVVAVDLLISQS